MYSNGVLSLSLVLNNLSYELSVVILGLIKSITVRKTLRIYIGDLKLVMFVFKHLIIHKVFLKQKLCHYVLHVIIVTNG